MPAFDTKSNLEALFWGKDAISLYYCKEIGKQLITNVSELH